MSNNQNRVFVVRKLPLPVPQLIKVMQAIVAAMTGNAHFSSPYPPLASVTAHTNTLDASQTATKTRAKGTVEARNAARTQCLSDMHALGGYVQLTADANPDQAEAIITSAGFGVRKMPAHTKAPFAVKQGPVSGSAIVTVKSAGLRAAYSWQWSGDAGKTWTEVAPTLKSKTEITGLPTLVTLQFRFRALTKTGLTDWSQPISTLVK